jgi:hypothetical protein
MSREKEVHLEQNDFRFLRRIQDRAANGFCILREEDKEPSSELLPFSFILSLPFLP